MSSIQEKFDEILNDGSYRLKTAYGNKSKIIDFYTRLVSGDDGTDQYLLEKYFETKTNLFVLALLLGYIHKTKSDKDANDSFIRAVDIRKYHEHTAIVKMIFLETYNDKENYGKDLKTIWTNFCKYADGGIEILLEKYETNNNKLDLESIYKETLPLMDQIVEDITPSMSETVD